MRRNVLVFHPLLPRPDQCCGDLQLVQLIGLLRRAGHHVTVVALEQLPDRAERARYARALTDLDCEVHELLPRAAKPPWSWELAKPALRAVLDRNAFDVALISFWNLAIDVVPYLRAASPGTRVVVHSWDVWHLREARGAALAGRLRRLRQVAAQRHSELAAYGLADAVLAVTDTDRTVIAAALGAAHAAGRLPDRWREPPPVVTVTLLDAPAAAPPAFAPRDGVVFVGYFVHPPNVDAALWLGRDIWPRVRRRLPQARLSIVGKYAPPEVTALAGAGIEVTGHVPDLGRLLDASRVSVAPLRFGPGLKGKVTQAMAAGLPVVTTPCGVEGLPAVSGHHVLIGETAEALADAIVQLHGDEALWRRIAAGGRALMEARCGEAAVAVPLFQALFGALPAAPAAPPAPSAEIAALGVLLDGLEWEHYRRTPSLALACYAEAARRDPTLAAAPLAAAALELSLGDVRAAAESLRRARRLAPDAPGLLAVQAAVLAAGGQTGPARRAVAAALAADPADPDALRIQGELLLAAGDNAGALRTLGEARRAAGDDMAIHRACTRAALATGQAGQALALLGQGVITAARTGQDRDEGAQRVQLRQLLDALGGPAPASGADDDNDRPAAPVAPAPAAAAATADPGAAPDVSIVVLTHNALAATRRCLASLSAHTGPAHELILVDNGSAADTVAFLRETAAGHPACRLILNAENLGFAAGNNLGLAAARGRDVVLVNSDVVVTPGWLERLLACADAHPRAGLVGPRTNRISGPQQVDDVAYDRDSLAGLDAWATRFAAAHAGEATAHWRAVGFCVLIRRPLLEAIGGLDPRFGRGNFEDDDYALRARLAGYESWIAGDCFVHHDGGRSFAAAGVDLAASLAANWAIFKAKWG
ncbi:MAG: glycosyltransferase, partial [Candidatus Krumholzibacteriia bacterium]